MRTRILLSLMAAVLVAFGGPARGALYGVNPFTNDATTPLSSEGLFTLDYNTGAIVAGTIVTVPARTITGLNSVTLDPTTGTAYAIVKAAAVASRILITLDLTTGVGVEIGLLGDNFSSLAFRSDGQLFGMTGDGAAVPETLFQIDKTTAVPVLATTLGNGADGEVIAYHPGDNAFYHWSGNGTEIFERVAATTPFAVTNIPISGPSVTAEIMGAVWDPARSQFLAHNIGSQMDFWTTAGVRSGQQAATTQDVRGLALGYFLTPSAGPNGTITPAAPRLGVPGAPASFTATPNPGFAVTFGGTCVGTTAGNTFTVTSVSADCTVTAAFAPAVFGAIPVPTMSQWMLALMAALMALGAFAATGRRARSIR